MSELYSVVVEKIEGPKLTMRVTTVHPDAGPPPKAPSFALNLVLDVWSLFDRGYDSLVEGVPRLGEEAAVALVRRAPWGPQLKSLFELSNGRDVPVKKEEYEKLNQAMMTGQPLSWQGQTPTGLSMRNGACFVSVPGDEAAFGRIATELVSRCEHDQPEHAEMYASWKDGSKDLPRVRIVATFAKPELLGFLKPGMKFDTAAYR